MSTPMSLKISAAVCASCLAVALAVSLEASDAAAASAFEGKHVAFARHRVHHSRITVYRDPRFRRGVGWAGQYRYLPPNAVRMPGYVFVPGVGILGESCDLPTSSCPNEYRDIQ